MSGPGIRIILVEGGLDPIHHKAYLQWLYQPQTHEEEAAIISTVAIKEFDGGGWRLFEPAFKNPRTITLSAYYRYSQRRHKVVIVLGSPGTYTYTLQADLTLRDDDVSPSRYQ